MTEIQILRKAVIEATVRIEDKELLDLILKILLAKGV